MGMKAYRFVGLNRDVYLPDNIKVVIDIVPSWRTNIRSNQPFSGQTSYTQHETANFNRGAGAWMHRNWLHGGAGGSYVGFNFVVDDQVIIQLTPLNEVTWHAGTPEGNKFSWGTELCVNDGINHDVARRNAAALAGGILAAMGWGTDRLFQHNRWWGKDCPYLLRRNGRWPVFVQNVDAFRQQALAASKGQPVPTTPAPAPSPYGTAKPVMVNGKAWDGTADVTVNGLTYVADPKTVTVEVDALNRRVAPKTGAALSGGALPKGEVFTVLGWVQGDAVDGENRWWVTPWGSHMWVGGTVEKPTERPKVDLNKLRTKVGENVYYPAGPEGKGREIVLIEDADLHRWADADSAKVGRVKAGQKVTALYWCKGDAEDGEHVWWVLKPESGDPIDKGPRLHAVHTFQRPF